LSIALLSSTLSVEAVSPASRGADSIKRGDDLLADDKLSEAIAAYQQGVQTQPSSSTAHQRLGRAYALSRRPKAASEQLREAISLDQNNATAHLDLGWVFGLQGLYQSSIGEERLAIRLDPRSVPAYLNLGVALAHEQDYEPAVQAFQSVLTLDPDNADANLNMASILARQGRYKEAEKLYRHSIKLDPKNGTAHLGLAGALGKLGDSEGQVAELRAAAALEPKNSISHGKLGWALYQKGDLKGALLHGTLANGLRLERATASLLATLLTVAACIFLLFGIVFSTMLIGTRFKPLSDETLLKSFFLVFYKEKPGRFVITDRRLVFSPETVSQLLGATRLSFDYVDIENFHSKASLRGGRLSLLCTNGAVYQFSMPMLVLEPLLDELRKIHFSSKVAIEEEIERASQVHLRTIKVEKAIESAAHLLAISRQDRLIDVDEKAPIITVVELPENLKSASHGDDVDEGDEH